MAISCTHVQLYAMVAVSCNHAKVVWGDRRTTAKIIRALRIIIARSPSCGGLSPGGGRGGRYARNPPGVPVRIVLPEARNRQLCKRPARCSCKGSPARDKKSERRRKRHSSSRTGDNNIDGGDDMYQHSSYVWAWGVSLCLVRPVDYRKN